MSKNPITLEKMKGKRKSELEGRQIIAKVSRNLVNIRSLAPPVSRLLTVRPEVGSQFKDASSQSSLSKANGMEGSSTAVPGGQGKDVSSESGKIKVHPIGNATVVGQYKDFFAESGKIKIHPMGSAAIVGPYKDAYFESGKVKVHPIASATAIVGPYKDAYYEAGKIKVKPIASATATSTSTSTSTGGQLKDVPFEFTKMGATHYIGENSATVHDGQNKNISESAKINKADDIKKSPASIPDNYEGKHAKLFMLCKIAHELDEREQAEKKLKEKEKAGEKDAAE